MVISIELAPEIERRITSLALRTGRSKASLLHDAIEIGLEDVEDYYMAAEVHERIRNGQERVYSSAEVRKELGLDD